MESSLHCNDLTYRLGLSAPKDGQRQCPACATHLDNLDDAVVTSLNPTEDYKTSILSGFSPAVIMECASRGLSFWSYQMAQEITYQAFLARNLTENYSSLKSDLDNTVREAHDVSQKLNHRIDALNADLAHVVEINQRLNDEVRKRTKAAQNFQSMYNKLKEHQLNVDVGVAASHDADRVLQNAVTGAQHMPHHRTAGATSRRSNSNGSGGGNGQNRRMTLAYVPGSNHINLGQGSRAGMGSSQNFQNTTPSNGNRQHLPTPTFGQYANGVLEGLSSVRNDTLRQATPLVHSHSHASQTGYRAAVNPGNSLGLSSNVKVGRQQQNLAQHRMASGYSALNIR